jgi:hypothetical protein
VCRSKRASLCKSECWLDSLAHFNAREDPSVIGTAARHFVYRHLAYCHFVYQLINSHVICSISLPYHTHPYSNLRHALWTSTHQMSVDEMSLGYMTSCHQNSEASQTEMQIFLACSVAANLGSD